MLPDESTHASLQRVLQERMELLAALKMATAVLARLYTEENVGAPELESLVHELDAVLARAEQEEPHP
jgi:hypothetical protein